MHFDIYVNSIKKPFIAPNHAHIIIPGVAKMRP